MREVGGPVERVEDPPVPGAAPQCRSTLLGQHVVIGKSPAISARNALDFESTS